MPPRGGGAAAVRLGRRGESVAAEFLERAGFTIVTRRFRRRWGEIDLVAEDPRGVVVFVEVKTRHDTKFGRPAEAVGRTKRERMSRVASAFLQGRGWLARPARFDVVEIVIGGGTDPAVRHIVDAFRLWSSG